MRTFALHPSWPDVLWLCKKLRSSGYEALLAGGCVRDAWLGRIPKDFDVATNAQPEQVEAVFEKSIPVGKAFGVVKVVAPLGTQIEVATFRRDGEYLDGRHPEKVEYSSKEEDAKRRDFTVNGLFYDIESGQMLDFVAGEKDLEARLIRAIGRAEDRFEEDKLRPLRALRFCAQLDFSLEKTTGQALRKFVSQLHQVSPERVQDELRKILALPGKAAGVQLLISFGVFQKIWPGFQLSVLSQARLRLVLEDLESSGDFALGLASIFYFESNELAQQLERLRLLKCSNEVIQQVCYFLDGIKLLFRAGVRRADQLRLFANPQADLLMALSGAVCRAEQRDRAPIDQILSDFHLIMDSRGQLPAPWVRGEDLLRAGKQQGPELGALLKLAYDWQLERQVRSREEALARLLEL